MSRPYQICSRCVMDTTDEAIRFDASGACDHCLSFDSHTKPNWPQGERASRQLERLAGSIKAEGIGRDQDCLIGMSGGVDSSYLLYLAVRRLGLRPLVFHVDAGWNSQVAVNNIERLVDGLGVDLHTEVIDWEEMRDLQLAFFRSGVPHIDTPQDHAFFATMYRFAERYRIRHILTGGNLSTECVRNPIEWMYYQSDVVQLLDIHRKFGTAPLRQFPTTSILKHKIVLPYFKRVQVHRPLNLVPYIKRDAIELLTNEFGWQAYPQKHFESRFTRFYEGFWLPTRFGIDVRRVQFSSLILTGQMSRAAALDELTRPAFDAEENRREVKFVASKLGITSTELLGFLDAPRRKYSDFRSQRLLYEIGARVLKFVGIEVGGKR